MNRKGSILVFVLALIVLLSVLSFRLAEETIQELRHVSQFHRRDDLRMHAYSALDLATGVLNEFKALEGQLYAPGQGWGDPIGYSGISPTDSNVRWSIKITDESAKLSLKKVSPKDLTEIFALMHNRESSLLDEDDGKPYYDALMDWQDVDEDERDDGAEDNYYEGLDDPYFTPGRPISNYEEFRMIKGFGYDEEESEYSGLFYNFKGSETSNMNDFRSSFSFFYEGPVNVNGMSSFLKKYLCGDDNALLDDLANGPANITGESFYTNSSDPNLNRLRTKTSIPLSVSASVFRVEISVNKGKSNFRLHAILSSDLGVQHKSRTQQSVQAKVLPRSRKNVDLQYPFRILSLRENENLID